MLTAQAELEKFLDRRSRVFEQAYTNLLASYGDVPLHKRSLADLTRIMQEALILADLNGRRRMLMEADWVKRRGDKARFSGPEWKSINEDPAPLGNGLTFEEALDNLITREPRLAQSAAEVSRLYSYEHVFAMARSSDLKLSERVQQAILQLEGEGRGLEAASKNILQLAKEHSHDWTRAYADTVYRTNISDAYNEARVEQAKDPDVQEIVPALMFSAINDPFVRPNHKAADGFIASTDDATWNWLKPPLGYQCRCGVDFVSIFELQRRGLIQNGRVIRYEPPGFARAHPDPGFKAGVY